MDDNKLLQFGFINEINSLIKLYKKHADLTGENFNVFSIMNMESDEVRTHSAIIGELLNPEGTHGLGNKPLKLFINQVIPKLNLGYESVQCFKEFYTGKLTEDNQEGGRLDLIIIDSQKNGFVIENKIYATEQRNQLLRYKKAYPEAELLFLTLEGDNSKEDSEQNYLSISYRFHILKWLESCTQIAYNKPMLREILNQYTYLIKKLTNQTINEEMQNQITDIILENFEASEVIYNNFQKALEKKQNDFLDSILEKLKSEITGWQIEKSIHKGTSCITLLRNGVLVRYRIKVYKHSAFGIEGINELNNELKKERFSEKNQDKKQDKSVYWLVNNNDITSFNLDDLIIKQREIVNKLKTITLSIIKK